MGVGGLRGGKWSRSSIVEGFSPSLWNRNRVWWGGLWGAIEERIARSVKLGFGGAFEGWN